MFENAATVRCFTGVPNKLRNATYYNRFVRYTIGVYVTRVRLKTTKSIAHDSGDKLRELVFCRNVRNYERSRPSDF